MALIHLLLSPWSVLLVVGALISSYLFAYFSTNSDLRGIKGPFAARYSHLWLLCVSRLGRRSEIVHELHQSQGPVIRLAPNHVSIADDEAIPLIYGHGNGLLKSDFYDAFVSIRRGLFNTRSRSEHSRKRKLVSHTFAQRSVVEFEPYVKQNVALFVKKWDSLIRGSRNKDGAAYLDCLDWFNFWAFDTIADLAFGKSFGMLDSGADLAEVRSSPETPPVYAPAVEILNRRGEVSATLGCMPWLKPFAKLIPDPFFSKGLQAVENLAGIAIARVTDRLDNPPSSERKDLLSRLQAGKDEKGEPLGREELTAEALTQLIAGSDTTSNSSCALMYHVVRTPGVLRRLQSELDEAIGDGINVPDFDQVKSLPYLEMVINETLRFHSTSGIGLPREVPPGSQGITVRGKHYPAGTILSVPTYSIHHSKEIWGDDADEFRPERWETLDARQKNAFIPFSQGPRSCVGRNLAEMQLKIITATWAKRYNVFLRQDHMQTREGFLRKPLGLEVGITRR